MGEQKPTHVRQQYSKEFKQRAVALAAEEGMSVSKVAIDLGISDKSIYLWRRQLATEGNDAFRGHGKRTALEQENYQLRKRCKILEQERDILREAALFFAKEDRRKK